MKIKSYYYLLPILLCFSMASISQDIHFSQFSMSPLTLNPSLSGALNDLEININYRDQWRSVASPYKTFGVGSNLKISKKKSSKGFWAGGVNFFSDKAGDSKMGTTQGNISLAYHIS